MYEDTVVENQEHLQSDKLLITWLPRYQTACNSPIREHA